ncbi:MAG: hypothetical protein ACRDYA_20825 [Egibacteraceae bacterium]
MICSASLVVYDNEQLGVSATVQAPWASVRFRVVNEPVEMRLETADTQALVRALLRGAQQLCDAAAVAGAALPGGWGRAALLLDDVLVALAETGQIDG